MSNEEKQTNVSQKTAKVETPSLDYENSPGKQLAKAREALGLTQKQVAERLHLRLASVQAVENDALEEGVSVTFNKGYVRLYAKLVNLEAQPLLETYDKLHQQDNQPAKLQSFSRRVTREAHDQRWNMVTIVVVLLVLGSVIGWWVQQSDSFKDSQNFVAETFDSLFNESDVVQSNNDISQANDDRESDIDSSTSIPDVDAVRLSTGPEISEQDAANLDEKVNELLQDVGLEEAQVTADLISQDVDEELNALASADRNPSESLEETDNDASSEINEQTTAIDARSSSLLNSVNGYITNDDGTVDMVFTFKDDCWVSVKDVNDEVIAIGVKVKGRVMEISGLPPIRVILGAPQSVDINFGGNDIDMSAYPGGLSANFALPVEND